MNLLENLNVLPKDGRVLYEENFLSEKTADDYFKSLMTNIEWENDEVFLFGKHIVTNRKVSFYGDDGIHYKYSGKKKVARK